MRIVSLLPSATEIVFRLGLDDHLVGVTFECDHPDTARSGRSIVVGGLDTSGLDPAAIDALVRAKVAAGEDLYRLDEAAFSALGADVVLTQDLCRVCALPSGHVDAAMSRLGCAADVVTLDPHRLDDVLATILQIAQSCGAERAGTDLVDALRARLAVVATHVAGQPRPRVLVLEWTEPPFLAGHWVPDLVLAAGAEPVLARPGERSVGSTWDAIGSAAADVVLVAPCGYGLADAVAQGRAVMSALPPSAAVWAIDANGYVVRPGPRLVDGVETLAAIFHPAVAVAPPDERIAVRLR